MSNVSPSALKPQNLPKNTTTEKWNHHNHAVDDTGTWEAQNRKIEELEARIKVLEAKP
ncbi:hypothetical protein NAD41_000866 [Salmonella enterica]|nr:hypothetical protein [Salmonella enterica]EKK6596250.1 hypothetical protein [Salmonella enterica]